MCISANPVSAVFKFCKLRTNNPAPKSSRKLNATCAAINPLRKKSDPLPELAIEPTVSFSAVHKSARLARSAGTNPNTSPVRSVTPSVKSKIRPSGVGEISSGFPSAGTNPSKPFVMPYASAIPTTPPSSESTMLSTRSCRTSCPRDAPSDKRTLISFCRAKARAISKFATFAHAISSTKPTIHISTMSAREKSLRKLE